MEFLLCLPTLPLVYVACEYVDSLRREVNERANFFRNAASTLSVVSSSILAETKSRLESAFVSEKERSSSSSSSSSSSRSSTRNTPLPLVEEQLPVVRAPSAEGHTKSD